MKTTGILFLMLAFARPAVADITDSGNLTIGGQGLIQGTMTVQGNAFSVGGSTFTVSAGTITAGVMLQAAAAGIRFSDGTTQTTAGGAPSGVWVEIASASIVSAVSYTFSNLASTTSYRLYFEFTQRTSNGYPYIQFNGDSGANYRFINYRVSDTGSGSTTQSNSATSCALESTTDLVTAGESSSGEINFATTPFFPGIRQAFVKSDYSTIGIICTSHAACKHNGSGDLASVTFGTSAGSMTGYLSLQKYYRK